MRRVLLSILVLAKASSGVSASCVDPATLVQSTVNISREFAEEEQKEAPGILGIRGTGWFLSPRLLVTAAHAINPLLHANPKYKQFLEFPAVATLVSTNYLLVVNAALFGLVAWLLDGFAVSSGMAAFFGWLTLVFVSWVAGAFIGPKGRYEILIVERR